MTEVPIAGPLAAHRAIRHCRTSLSITVRAAPAHAIGLVGLAALAGAAPVVTAWLLKLVLDWLVAGRPGVVLTWLAAGMAVLWVVAAVLPRIRAYSEAELYREVRLLSFSRVFQVVTTRLRGLPTLEDPRFHDRLQLAAMAGSSAPGQVFGHLVGFGQASITLLGFVTTLVVINPWLALVVTVAAAPTLRAEVLISRRRVGAMWRIEHAERRRLFYSNLLSYPQFAKEMRLLGLGGFFRERMLGELRTSNQVQRSIDRRELAVQSTLAILGAGVAGAGLVWAISAARSGGLTVGDISVFVAALVGFQGGLSELIGRFGQLHQGLLMLNHYQHVVTVPPDVPVRAEPRPVPPLRHGIEVRDVWFRYGDGRPWALRGVTFSITAGQALALVGVNGAGKTTLVKLLCRFYDPTHGTITWDGVNLSELDPDALRERMSVLFQDYVEYDLSAAENIGIGELTNLHDRSVIREAARRAGVHDAIEALPDGYDTLLTRMYMTNADRDDPDTGVLLSGGQGQRLALARAFFRDRRDLLVLDEPSAGLDAEAEAMIHQSIRRYRAGRTSLLISHRLNTVRDVDRIAVVADGKIVEEGEHDELMAHGGVYARLFTTQARGYAATVP